VKTEHKDAPAPAAPQRGGRWGLDVLPFHIYEAPPGAPERLRKTRFKAKALLSNIADFCVNFWCRGREHLRDKLRDFCMNKLSPKATEFVVMLGSHDITKVFTHKF
jgi:hypothetical protein